MFTTLTNTASFYKSYAKLLETISVAGTYAAVGSGQGVQANVIDAGNFGIICGSDDGQYLYMGKYAGTGNASVVFRSINGGTSWSAVVIDTTSSSVAYVACSSTGQYVVAIESSLWPKWSNDYGATWRSLTNGTGSSWQLGANSFSYRHNLCISDDGRVYICCHGSNASILGVYVCAAPGGAATFTQALAGITVTGISCSPDGKYVVCGTANAGNAFVYYSSNYGISFSTLGVSTAGNYRTTAVSSNGQIIYVGNNSPNEFKMSSNGFASFGTALQWNNNGTMTNINNIFSSGNGGCSCSASGVLCCVISANVAYYSTNSGVNWKALTTLTPAISTAISIGVLSVYVSKNGKYIYLGLQQTVTANPFIYKITMTQTY